MKFMGAKVKLKFQTHKDIYVIRQPIQTIEKGRRTRSNGNPSPTNSTFFPFSLLKISSGKRYSLKKMVKN